MENRFIIYSSADDFFIHDKESDRFLDKYEIVAYLIGQDRQITDLEAKLAESEKTEDGAFWFEKWQHKKRDYDSVYKAYIENCAEVDQLKQQLAEKEKEVEELKTEIRDELVDNNMAILELQQSQNQTAIAVLEEMLENEIYLNVIPDFECGDYVSSKIIKTKIEELKNGRN